jgi:hypothetical protein
MRALVYAVALSACSTQQARTPAAADPPPASGDLGALGLALAQVDVGASRAWLDRAPTDDPIPFATGQAVLALHAWARTPTPLRLYCGGKDVHREYLAIRVVAETSLATGAADDVLRLSEALRTADNSSYAIALGIHLATDVEVWRNQRHTAETDAMRAAAPGDDLRRRAAIAEARCAAQQLAYLGDDADAAAFVAETRAIIARTPSDDDLSRVLHERAGETDRPSLAATIAAPRAFEETERSLERYRVAQGGGDPDR